MEKFLFSISIILTLGLAACSSTSIETPESGTDSELSVETQLALGTLKLAGTEQDLSIGQAEELILYWQVFQELSQSDTSAQAEVNGLLAQIQETMTDEQMQTIAAMDLTQQDVFTAMQGRAVVSNDASDSTVSDPSGGSIPAGGPPPDGGAPPDGGVILADMGGAAPASGVDQAQAAEAGSGFSGTIGVPAALLQELIQSLQQKIAA